MVLGLDQIGTIFTGDNADDLGLLPVPRDQPALRPGRGRGADRRLMMVDKSPKNQAGAVKLLEYLGTAKPPSSCGSAPTRPTSPPPRRGRAPVHPAAERRRRS